LFTGDAPQAQRKNTAQITPILFFKSFMICLFCASKVAKIILK